MENQDDFSEYLAWRDYKKKLWQEQNKEKIAAQKKAYYLANKERIKETQTKWRRANLEKMALKSKKYRLKNPDKASSYTRMRRALIKGSKVKPYTADDVLKMYGDNCHICGKKIDLTAPRFQGKKGWQHGLHIDHIVPISKGGADIIENVRPAHGVCNLSKGARS